MTDKTTAALKLAEEARTPLKDLLRAVPKDGRDLYEEDKFCHHNIPYGRLIHEALAEIERLEALADHSGGANEMVAEPVKQEPVMDYEYICALREGEQHQAEDSYFFVRPENDTPTLRKMFCQGFERGFHKGLKYAAPVSVEAAVIAEREACAKVVESTKWSNWFQSDCAAAIRSRSDIVTSVTVRSEQ